MRLQRLREKRHDVDGLPAVGERAAVGQRQLVQIVDQLAERADLGAQRLERFARKRAHAVLERLELARKHGERRAQLVRYIGHEAAPQRLVPLERLRQAVEVLGEAPELVGGAHFDARRVIARGEPVRRSGDALERQQEDARQDEREQRGERHGECGDDPGGALLLLLERKLGGRGEPPQRRARDPADRAPVDLHRAHCAFLGQLRVADHRAPVLVEEREARDRLVRHGKRAQARVVVAQELPAAGAAVFVGEAAGEPVDPLRVDLVEIAEEAGLETRARGERHRGGGDCGCRQDDEEQLERDPGLHSTRIVRRARGAINRGRPSLH